MFVDADGAPVVLPDPDCANDVTLEVLRKGAIELLGRIPGSSNATFLCVVANAGVEFGAILKPGEGEYPLWDFPEGNLYRREIAAYELSELLGWGIVPPTVLRDEAPFGAASLQRVVTHDPAQHFFTLFEEHIERFATFAAFDVLANNTDRKGGHCLQALRDNTVVGIDHGLTFHAVWKLRTVIWQFGGEPIPERLLNDIARVLPELDACLGPWLTNDEVAATRERATAMLAARVFPDAGDDPRRFPWPLV